MKPGSGLLASDLTTASAGARMLTNPGAAAVRKPYQYRYRENPAKVGLLDLNSCAVRNV